MRIVTIKYFKEKHQERVTFVRTLVNYQNDLGLKSAKYMLDNMLDGVPIQYSVPEHKLDEFISHLDSLNLEYCITQ